MNITRYTLPVVIAAGLHGSFFMISYLTTDGSVPVKAPSTVVTVGELPLTFPKDPEPEPASVAEVESLPAAQKGEALPELPELPVMTPTKLDCTVEVSELPEIAPRAAEIWKIGLRGAPDGVEGGIIHGVPKIFSAGDLDSAPRARVQRAPMYPMSLKHQGIEGSVVVEFEVNTRGEVVWVKAVRYTHNEFVDAALSAVRSWRFEAGKRRGRPVPFRMIVPIQFGLESAE